VRLRGGEPGSTHRKRATADLPQDKEPGAAAWSDPARQSPATAAHRGGSTMGEKKTLKKFSRLGANASGAWEAYRAFDQAALADGAIPKKYKELMAVAVAMTTQCRYCIDIHAAGAREAGATEEELAEAVFVAAALRAGAAVTHGAHRLDLDDNDKDDDKNDDNDSDSE
jgi:AhpD family alkylhydroperoxidase